MQLTHTTPAPVEGRTVLEQYRTAKEAHPGILVLIRVGDFYECYGPDAETLARDLEITLTGRPDDSGTRIPMAGVPFHSVEKYLARLLQKGHKVALCDQLEDPKATKGLVKRGVTRELAPEPGGLPFAPTSIEVNCISCQPGQSASFWYGTPDTFAAAMRFAESQVGPIYHQVSLTASSGDPETFAIFHLCYLQGQATRSDWRTWFNGQFAGGHEWTPVEAL